MYYIQYWLPTILFLTLLRKYQEYKWGRCKNTVSLTGKVVLITGANSGIGFETAKDLAKRGAKIIFACRDLDKANAAITKIQLTLKTPTTMIPMELDLQSIKSITTFIDEIKKSEEKIDILINNAGVSYPRQADVKTSDGFEIHFGVNHLSHFYLTNKLVPLLRNAAPSRVVIVSSTLHQKGRIYLDDLNSKHKFDKTPAYNNSKLANAYFAQELARKVKPQIKVYCVCPGWVYTGLFRNHNIKWFHYFFIAPIAFMFMRSPKQGAQTLIYCATEPDLIVDTGLFYRDCKEFQSTVNFERAIAEELWVNSEQMIEDVQTKLM